jgi:hypothetical protein
MANSQTAIEFPFWSVISIWGKMLVSSGDMAFNVAAGTSMRIAATTPISRHSPASQCVIGGAGESG